MFRLKDKIKKFSSVMLLSMSVVILSSQASFAYDPNAHRDILKGAAKLDTHISTYADDVVRKPLLDITKGTFTNSIFNGAKKFSQKQGDGSYRTRYEMSYLIPGEDEKELLFDTVSEILDIIIEDDFSDAQKVEAIVKFLHENITYGFSDPSRVSPHSVYRLISHGEGYCQTYASSFQLMAEMAGLDSIYAVGDTPEGLHAWNMVKLDGKWVGVDVTWHRYGKPYYYTNLEVFGKNREMPQNLYEAFEYKLDNVKFSRKYSPYLNQ